jgi:hypothetical protein
MAQDLALRRCEIRRECAGELTGSWSVCAHGSIG